MGYLSPHLGLLLMSSVLMFLPVALATDQHGDVEFDLDLEERYLQYERDGVEIEPSYGVLFPWFTEAVGVVVFLILTRVHILADVSNTAVMFLVGTGMGIGIARTNLVDELSLSTSLWASIDGELVLNVFLPGLLFHDAFAINFHLFLQTLNQVLILAFPMVLENTVLTALIAYYVFPYGWSFMFAMTFGSILGATDPVAVSALLDQVGAPPRLQMQISGESMFNDGSATVFYDIFSAIFLYELALPGGKDYTVGEGFARFFRMSLGAAAVGIAFGLGLISFLYCLNRRLSKAENVLQVAATITVAYLAFYTAEITSDMSGVISVVMCGITTSAFASGMINDPQLMGSFWSIVNQLLDTLLFTLGGVVWGHVIGNGGVRDDFTGQDWGYCILVFVLLNVMRFFLVFAHYPILSRIGLGTNWQESTFLSYSGLRGAVAISLSIKIDSQVWAATEDPEARDFTSKLFGMIGGVAFMTLWVNGTTAGPILKALGLAKSSEMRDKVVDQIHKDEVLRMQEHFVTMLTDPRFAHVEFPVISYHVPPLKDLTVEQVDAAVQRDKKKVPAGKYKKPNLERILPYLKKEGDTADSMVKAPAGADDTSEEETSAAAHKGSDPELASSTKTGQSKASPEKEDTSTAADEGPDPELASSTETGQSKASPEKEDTAPATKSPVTKSTDDNTKLTIELRSVFLELLQAAYTAQVQSGKLNAREGSGSLLFVLQQSIQFAEDKSRRGMPLQDWDSCHVVNMATTDRIKIWYSKFKAKALKKETGDSRAMTAEYQKLRFDVNRAFAFVEGHGVAQERFQSQFSEASSDELKASARTVLSESEAEVDQAQKEVLSYDQKDVHAIISHSFCSIILNKSAMDYEKLTTAGLLSEREARGFVDTIDAAILGVQRCSMVTHPSSGSSDQTDKDTDNTWISVMLKNEQKRRAAVRQKFGFTLSSDKK